MIFKYQIDIIFDGICKICLKTYFEKAYFMEYLRSDNKITVMKNIMNFPEQV